MMQGSKLAIRLLSKTTGVSYRRQKRNKTSGPQKDRTMAQKITCGFLLLALSGVYAKAQVVVPSSGSSPSTPFQQQIDLSIYEGGKASSVSVGVPAGKVLVIEFVSLSSVLPTGQKLAASIGTTATGSQATYVLPTTTYDSPIDGTDAVRANQVMRVYADGGSIITLMVVRNSAKGVSQVGLAISGHLVDVPQVSVSPQSATGTVMPMF